MTKLLLATTALVGLTGAALAMPVAPARQATMPPAASTDRQGTPAQAPQAELSDGQMDKVKAGGTRAGTIREPSV